MDDIYTYDPTSAGAKGLVYAGDKALFFRRDGNTDKHPFCIDIVGGYAEGKETPFETFKREAKEELNIDIEAGNIVYAKKYAAVENIVETNYFPVAKLPYEALKNVRLGEEGLEWYYMDVEEYIQAKDANPVFQKRAKEYLDSIA